MLTHGFEAAWDIYLRAGRWLPPAPAPVTPRRVADLAEVLETEDVAAVVLDAYGVLHTGPETIPGAAEAIADVRRRGLPLAVLTNDVTHEPSGVAAGLARRGLDIRANEVISGRDGLPEALTAVGGGAGWGVAAIEPAGLVGRFPGLTAIDDMAGFDGRDWDALAGLVLVDCFHWVQPDLDSFRRLMRRRPLPLIIPNPDVACPYGGAMTMEPGALALWAAQTLGAKVTFLGKPFPALYQSLLSRLTGIAPDRVLMVGDSPHTDVLGARGAGMRCLLVESGLLAGQDALSRCREAGLWPDFVAASIHQVRAKEA